MDEAPPSRPLCPRGRVILPKDYLRLKLTGELANDASDAAGTLWLDPAKRDWDDTLLAATGLSRAHMPRLVEGSDVSGTLLPAVAAAWALPTSVVVAGGALVITRQRRRHRRRRARPGLHLAGTSGVMFLVTDAFRSLTPAVAVRLLPRAAAALAPDDR